MDEQEFARIKAKAMAQSDDNNMTHSDNETMALQISWLNSRYRGQGAYFALLDEPGLGLETFPVPDGYLVFLFRRHQQVWSVARVKRYKPKVTLFDSVTAKPPHRLQEDSARAERLQHLAAAVRRHLPLLRMPATVPEETHDIVSPVPNALSATMCLAWTEATFRDWPIGHFLVEGEYPCWVPCTDQDSATAEICEDGDVDWWMVLMRRARQSTMANLSST